MRLIDADAYLKSQRPNGVSDEVWKESNLYKSISSFPTAQPEQNKMIEEIRKWINSGNRGSADYFIVDRIEEIINKYE